MPRNLAIAIVRDGLCGSCLDTSSRMRTLADALGRRTQVPQDSPLYVAERRGRPKAARRTILGHRADCRRVSDRLRYAQRAGRRVSPARGGIARDDRPAAGADSHARAVPTATRAVEADRQEARRPQVRAIPARIAPETGTGLGRGVTDDRRPRMCAAA